MKHISTVVLQDVQSQKQIKAEDYEEKDIKHEKCLTQKLVPRIKILKEVKMAITADCMLLYIFMFKCLSIYVTKLDRGNKNHKVMS